MISIVTVDLYDSLDFRLLSLSYWTAFNGFLPIWAIPKLQRAFTVKMGCSASVRKRNMASNVEEEAIRRNSA
jgi:hypothetical protein